MDNEKYAIRISNVKKQYRLGQIGGGTLTADLQSWWARIRGKEDPNMKINQDQRLIGQTFMALNGINLTIKPGEAVGIIGHNGAGKSTLLKLLCRVTTPTYGTIDINGRITSMLEVGTGFHGEMTGRENVYLNGAILGMTKSEIDSKMDQIIEFSEIGEFIDTPVKRYSSGMYVKLAFSVAAHLDSEIMIMDEVLAVGDMAFQNKCINKMLETVKQEGKTVLYISHNMNTVRQLCDRCIVLNHGKVIFDGEVESAIEAYLDSKKVSDNNVDLESIKRSVYFSNHKVTMSKLYVNCERSVFPTGSKIDLKMVIKSPKEYDSVILEIPVRHISGISVTRFMANKPIRLLQGENTINFQMDVSYIAPGKYTLNPLVCLYDDLGNREAIDSLNEVYVFEILPTEDFNNGSEWLPQYFGYIVSPKMKISE